MSNRQAFIQQRLLDSGQATYGFFEGLSEDEYRTQVYLGGDKWTVHHILAHFVSAERKFVEVLTNWLNGGSAGMREFDIEAFNVREVRELSQLDRATLLNQFSDQREKLAEIAMQVTDAQMEEEGEHPWLGPMSMERFLKFIYRHTQIHEKDIRGALAIGGPISDEQALSPRRPE